MEQTRKNNKQHIDYFINKINETVWEIILNQHTQYEFVKFSDK